MASLIKVTLKRGLSKCSKEQIDTIRGLGLRKPHQTRYLKDLKPIRGMVLKMQHMLEVELVQGDDSLRQSARLRSQRALAAKK